MLYRDRGGSVPILDWFDTLVPRAQDKCRVKIERLRDLGHELRQPESDYLRDGIYELRAKHAGMNYRLLYFFGDTTTVVLSHGFFKKQSRVPEREIGSALRRKADFEARPLMHTYQE